MESRLTIVTRIVDVACVVQCRTTPIDSNRSHTILIVHCTVNFDSVEQVDGDIRRPLGDFVPTVATPTDRSQPTPSATYWNEQSV